MNKTTKFATAWLAKFYDETTSIAPSRTALIGAATEEEAAEMVAPVMGLHMRVDVVRIILKPEKGAPFGEILWLN